jgi:glycosyltransferase involved in cell wall biosynthesis
MTHASDSTADGAPRRTIVYVGDFSFPVADAGALRVLGIGKALRAAEYQVRFVGMERSGREEDRQAEGGFSYQGFPYVPEQPGGATWFPRVRRALVSYLSGTTTMRRLGTMDLRDVRAIIAYQSPSLLLRRLQSFCRVRGIQLLADTTEWYDPWHVTGGALGPLCWDSELRMRCVQPSVGRVIAISSYLERYYRERRCAVLRVPPLIDVDELPRPEPSAGGRTAAVLRLVYAGTPGKKELLENAIRGLHLVLKQGKAFDLHLVGLRREELAARLAGDADLLDQLGDAVVCHGRVSHADAMALVAQADFSILLRPDKRFAHAGFPTKLVESLALGVPVLTNLTSDVGDYVRDGREAIVLPDGSPEAFAQGVRRTLAMPRSAWMLMRENARRQASDCFDYRRYGRPLREFIEGEGAGRHG